MSGMITKKISFSMLCFRCILIILLLAILLQKVFILAYIPSESMQPGLEPGCVIIGLRLKPDIARGSILIFRHNNTVYIKRLVGLSGEQVVIKYNGDVIIDGYRLKEDYVTFQRFGAEMEFDVPDGCLLFLGDNRNQSYDARYWSDPYVSEADVLATAKFTIFPHISIIEQENYMNKNMPAAIIALVGLIIVLILANRFINSFSDGTESNVNELLTSIPVQNTSSDPLSNNLPDFMRGEKRDYIAEPLDTDNLSPTVLSESEITTSIIEQLSKLRNLSPDCLEHVSPVTVEGQHNPFYYMVAAAMKNETARNAFLAAGQRSSYEVIGIEKLGKNNTYVVSVLCKAPYLAAYLQYENSTETGYYKQDYTGFVSSGAAGAVSKMNMDDIELITDKVDLFVVVQEDIPIIFYTASTNYGYSIPQYAFLWGFYLFDGINDGDLQYPNTLGAFNPVDRETVSNELPNSTDRLDFTEKVIQKAKQGDLYDAIYMGIDGFRIADTFKYGRQMSVLIDAYNKEPATASTFEDNLLNCDIIIQYYHSPAPDGLDVNDGYAIELTYYPHVRDWSGKSGYTAYAVCYPDEPEDAINDSLIDLLAGLLVHGSGI